MTHDEPTIRLSASEIATIFSTLAHSTRSLSRSLDMSDHKITRVLQAVERQTELYEQLLQRLPSAGVDPETLKQITEGATAAKQASADVHEIVEALHARQQQLVEDEENARKALEPSGARGPVPTDGAVVATTDRGDEVSAKIEITSKKLKLSFDGQWDFLRRHWPTIIGATGGGFGIWHFVQHLLGR